MDADESLLLAPTPTPTPTPTAMAIAARTAKAIRSKAFVLAIPHNRSSVSFSSTAAPAGGSPADILPEHHAEPVVGIRRLPAGCGCIPKLVFPGTEAVSARAPIALGTGCIGVADRDPLRSSRGDVVGKRELARPPARIPRLPEGSPPSRRAPQHCTAAAGWLSSVSRRDKTFSSFLR